MTQDEIGSGYMKLAFSTLPCMDYSAEKLIDYCKKYKIDGLEIRAGADNSILGEKEENKLELFGEQFAKADITILCIATSICFKGYEPHKIKEATELIERGKKIGAKGIRIFLGNFARRFDTKLGDLDHVGIVQSLREICDIDEDIEVMVETHNEYATGRVLSSLKKDVDRENLKFIWDIIHPIEDGEDIEATWSYIGRDITHLHIKDGKKQKDTVWHDYEYTLLGDGELPIESILQLLRRNNFDGFLSLEWESVWREELKKYPSDMDFLLTMFKTIIEGEI
jgi:sugar phosphate isomerase/epimerase